MGRLRAVGCDISHYQGKTDFVKMKDSGLSFVYIKASQNLGKSDCFDEQWKAAKEAGLLRGAYHFYDLRPESVSSKEQANFFSEILADDLGELRPVLDFENPGKDGYPDLPLEHSECERIVRQFSEKVEENLGIWPMLYVNLDGLKRLEPLTAQLASMDLWIAWYSWHSPKNQSTNQPIHGSWPDWRFWQYKNTGDGHGHGVDSTSIDMDVFNGTINELYNYANMLKLTRRSYHL